MKVYSYSYPVLILFVLLACKHIQFKNNQTAEAKQTEEAKQAEDKPQKLPGYKLDKPQVFKMPDVLNEISGIAFLNGNADAVYAEEDEDGKLFRFSLGSESITETKWGKKGDYEDVQLCNGYVVMLRSNGVLFSFSLQEVNNGKVKKVNKFDDVLPQGEYEGLYADNTSGKLYVLCKHCNEKMSVSNSGYVFSITDKGDIKPAGNFSINVKDIIKRTDDKIHFEPSALAKNELTGDWFIVSSVNKLLVLTDSNWNVKAAYPLDKSIYNQPEGIAFDKDNNLYISNEKGSTGSATILKILYQKP